MSGAQATSFLSVDDVVFAYRNLRDGDRPVLDHLSFTAAKGQIIAVLGRNGSGKSTLFSVLRGACIPASGRVSIEGHVVAEDGRLRRRPRVSLVQQRVQDGLAPSMSLFENYLLLSKQLSWRLGINWRAQRERCMQVLSSLGMGLEGRLDEQARFLSVGQQQALCLRCALEGHERLLLLDEPTASLDVETGERLIRTTIADARARTTTVLIISHRLAEVIDHVDRVCLLEGGRISQDVDVSAIGADRRAVTRLLG